MPVIRTNKQSSQSLEEFYDALMNSNEGWSNVTDSMLDLINRFNEEFPNEKFYALTSHSRLVILENEEVSSNWLVIFQAPFQMNII